MNDTIATVHAEDVKKARKILQEAIAQAGEAWIPSDAVLDALTLELIEMVGRSGNSTQAASHLMKVGAQLKSSNTRFH